MLCKFHEAENLILNSATFSYLEHDVHECVLYIITNRSNSPACSVLFSFYMGVGETLELRGVKKLI